MRKLLFEEMLLLSNNERTARRLKLHPQATVIRGENDTGKSSLIKSLYWVLGADAAKIHPRWRNLEVRGLLHFRINDDRYSMLRSGSLFALFDRSARLLGRYTSVTEQLGPALADMLGFKLLLANRSSDAITPPPAYMFLPFYMDQDQSWTRNLSSFARLGQFASWQQPVVEYFAGVRSSAFYEAKAEILKTEREMIAPQTKVTALELSQKLVSETYPPAFEIDVDAFKKQIEELVNAAQQLQRERDACRRKLTELGNAKVRIESQIEIVKQVAVEIDKDYEFAAHDTEGDQVDCPLCGAVYANNFRERFEIAQDLGRCNEFDEALQKELQDVEAKIIAAQEELKVISASYERARTLLTEKQREVTLQDLINNEARRTVASVLDNDLRATKATLGEIERRNVDAKNALQASQDTKRRKAIVGDYLSLMREFLYKLDVETMDEKSYSKMYASISETGSDLPRALLAYQFAILKLAARRDSSPFCPIVIDSPNQQDQDPENYLKMLTFIKSVMEPGWQLILGTVRDMDVSYGGSTLDMGTRKFSALRSEEFEEVSAAFDPFFAQSVGARQ